MPDPRPRSVSHQKPPRNPAPSTVGRSKAVTLKERPAAPSFKRGQVTLELGDSLQLYPTWGVPSVIVSDGAYGILGFDGDTSDHLGLTQWYQSHVRAWSQAATAATTLWFWNSEIGWAAVHPLLEAEGWRYVGCNVWNKGSAHIAGNVSTQTIRRFPVVTEVCVQYVRAAEVGGLPLKVWLRQEWKRTGLKLSQANIACGVKDAAVRKYLDQGHLWYFPPPAAMEKLSRYANRHGRPDGRPYFSLDGQTPVTARVWKRMRSHFRCPHGVTNVWDRAPVRDEERVKTPSGRAVHLNQKPLDLMERLIVSSSEPGDTIWEPFGGLFTAALAALRLGRRAHAAELDPTYFEYGRRRLAGG